MNSKKKIIPNELSRLISGRDTFERSNTVYIENRILSHEFILRGRINTNQGIVVGPIHFSECEFEELVRIGNYMEAGNIIFTNCIFKKNIIVHEDNTSLDESNSFKSDLEIIAKAGKDLIINNYIVDETFEISGSLNSILISNVKSKNFNFSTTINSGEIKNLNVSEQLIVNSELNGPLELNDSSIKALQIKTNGGQLRSLKINNCKIESFEHTLWKLRKLVIQNSEMHSLQFLDSNPENSIIDIKNSILISLCFKNVLNIGSLTLRELKILQDGLISFRESNMGKADFIFCNFSKAGLEFQNSKIAEAFFSETEFPKRVIVDGKINYPQAQLTFGQLAVAFQRQGDNIRALEFNSRELEAHFKSIRWFSKSFFSKFSLFFYSISNDFGRNWFKGVLFSFGIGLLFFCLLLISTDRFAFGFPTLDYGLLPPYLKFMNPLRFFELDTLFNNSSIAGKVSLTPNSYLTDFWGRVFVAYGYYQTIQAFRRFGRK